MLHVVLQPETCLGKKVKHEESQVLVDESVGYSGFLLVKNVAHYAKHLNSIGMPRYFHGLVEGGVHKIDLYLASH